MRLSWTAVHSARRTDGDDHADLGRHPRVRRPIRGGPCGRGFTSAGGNAVRRRRHRAGVVGRLGKADLRRELRVYRDIQQATLLRRSRRDGRRHKPALACGLHDCPLYTGPAGGTSPAAATATPIAPDTGTGQAANRDANGVWFGASLLITLGGAALVASRTRAIP